MAEGQFKTITIAETDKRPWQKPGSEQFWHTIVIKEFPSEPIKFIQDKAKGAPTPEVGKQFQGKVYRDEKGGMKFYPSTPRQSKQSRDDAAIRAQWAIGQSVAWHSTRNTPDTPKNIELRFASIEEAAKKFYAMVDEVKNSNVVTGEQKTAQPISDPEFASLMATSIDQGTEINVDDIPF